jgi:hypothetical protein
VPSSYPVLLRDIKGRTIGRGRTANISERGVFVLVPDGRTPAQGQTIEIEMDLPHSPAHQRMRRTVRYAARVVRVEPMGRWQGIALELGEKLG